MIVDSKRGERNGLLSSLVHSWLGAEECVVVNGIGTVITGTLAYGTINLGDFAANPSVW